LRCIAGLTAVDAGKILLDGQDIVPLSPQKRGIGMVFQSYALFPNMTVEQNVAFGLRMQKVDASDSRQRVLEILRRWSCMTLPPAIPINCPAANASASPSPAPL
jgi:putative spermidine/putrescine transport system ATP-binding protein